MNDNYLNSRSVLALYLYEHPFEKVWDDETFFWYDDKQRKFFWTKPSNKVKNGVYEARGLNSWFRRYISRDGK